MHIDSGPETLKEFAHATKGMTALIEQTRKRAIFSDGTIPQKYKILAAMVWSIAEHCEPCLNHYVRQALKNGTTEEELGEFLAVTIAMGGCVGETWALKAYKAYREARNQPGD